MASSIDTAVVREDNEREDDLELAERIVGRTGSNSRIDKIPYEEAYERGFEDMRRRVPDTTKIRSLIGWEPSHDLNQIIDEVAEHVRGLR
mgnify:CR=1 FL=1